MRKTLKSVVRSLKARSASHVDADHLFALVGLNTLDPDPAQLSGTRHATGKFKNLVQSLLFHAQFVDAGRRTFPAHG